MPNNRFVAFSTDGLKGIHRILFAVFLQRSAAMRMGFELSTESCSHYNVTNQTLTTERFCIIITAIDFVYNTTHKKLLVLVVIGIILVGGGVFVWGI